MRERTRIHYFCEGGKGKSVPRDHWYNSASLVLPNGDPWDKISYPTLALMIDSNILSQNDTSNEVCQIFYLCKQTSLLPKLGY